MLERAFFFGPILVLIGTMGCLTPQQTAPTSLKTGEWRVELDLNGHVLPFRMELLKADSTWSATILNDTERIVVHDLEFRGDTFQMRMPLFDSEFKGVVLNDSTIEGHWYNYLKGPEYRIPFVAMAGPPRRAEQATEEPASLSGTWEVHFSRNTPDAYNAIGLFEHHPGGRATGTFITETGDYRYLEGSVSVDSLSLSCFDGSHAFLFTAGLVGDSLLGRFWSGTHWEESWVAYRNPTYQLRDPDSLTFLREGYNMVDFRFPDLEGRPLSPLDDRFRDKVLLIQIMGSWCPNCVDETNLLNEVHQAYRQQGLEVIAVAFEKHRDDARALAGLVRFREVMGVEYPIVYGGPATKEHTAKALPFLEHIKSYPTCIFVDRTGVVRRIRTGFYGPGTGTHYANYSRNLHTFVKELLAEPPRPRKVF